MTDTRTGTSHPVRKNRHDRRARIDPDEPGTVVEKTFQSPKKLSCRCGGVMVPGRDGSYGCAGCGRTATTRRI